MKLCFDTSVVVDIDREREGTVELMKHLTEEDHALLISTVTVAEILTGAYRLEKEEVREARKVLGQFHWIDLDGAVADRTGELMAELYEGGNLIEFQDVVIAASADVEGADRLVTGNLDHFDHITSIDPEVVAVDGMRSETGF